MANYSYLKDWGFRMVKIMLERSLEDENADDLMAASRELARREKEETTMRVVRRFLKKNKVADAEFEKLVKGLLEKGGDSIGVAMMNSTND